MQFCLAEVHIEQMLLSLKLKLNLSFFSFTSYCLISIYKSLPTMLKVEVIPIFALIVCVRALETIEYKTTHRPESANDIAEEDVDTGETWNDSSDIEFLTDTWSTGIARQHVGVRFPYVDIPTDLDIEWKTAYVRFFATSQIQSNSSEDITILIHGLHGEFNEKKFGISRNRKTQSYVVWKPDAQYNIGEEIRTPNLSDLVIEMIENGWKHGKRLSLLNMHGTIQPLSSLVFLSTTPLPVLFGMCLRI
eukprot:m.137448 g.137448  ORF g.137448 m.137448 type:complete len:248 (+) comp14752_c0_seq12:172-915(+)